MRAHHVVGRTGDGSDDSDGASLFFVFWNRASPPVGRLAITAILNPPIPKTGGDVSFGTAVIFLSVVVVILMSAIFLYVSPVAAATVAIYHSKAC